jgi:hypothetical protein
LLASTNAYASISGTRITTTKGPASTAGTCPIHVVSRMSPMLSLPDRTRPEATTKLLAPTHESSSWIQADEESPGAWALVGSGHDETSAPPDDLHGAALRDLLDQWIEPGAGFCGGAGS